MCAEVPVLSWLMFACGAPPEQATVPAPPPRVDEPSPHRAEPDPPATAPPRDLATAGPFTVSCDGAQCTVHHGDLALGEPLGAYDRASALLRPLPNSSAWIGGSYAGDGCPSLYQVFCVVDGQGRRSETFGNCDEPSSIQDRDGRVEITFAGWKLDDEHERRPETASVDPTTCQVVVQSG